MLGLAAFLGFVALALSLEALRGRAGLAPQGPAMPARARRPAPAIPPEPGGDTRIQEDLEDQVASIMRALGDSGPDGRPGADDRPAPEPRDDLPVFDGFDVARDVIVIEIPDGLTDLPEVTVRGLDDGSIVSVGGTDIARIRGAHPRAEDAVRLVVGAA